MAMPNPMPLCVAFDCDGVLASSISSWGTLHDHFGTDSSDLLKRFLAGEFGDEEFMAMDIEMWKEKRGEIHRDDIFRAFSGCKLMKGAKELVADLRSNGIHVAIVSAGIDLYVQSIAGLVKADDWIANGFEFDDEGWLLSDGILRVPSKGKDGPILKLLEMIDCPPERLVSVGDSSMDLSMMVEGSTFIGFNPQREDALEAFNEAGVTVVNSNNLDDLRPLLGLK
ncbi:MAG: HAD family phosphatase [Candidatus Poseidoniaceae archaeon]|jgi:HAD superfamily PSPase-like hydrolase|nr:HAD family phosphatase [Candidatus Poseidoniaceae archaeon]